MAESIMQDEKACYITESTTDLHKHHIYFGNPGRKLSEKYGCWVWLRSDWHNMSNYSVHSNRELDLILKRSCQKMFSVAHPNLNFVDIFGRNYLEEYE